MKPILYNILAFDGINEQTFQFLWNGNQAFGNVCVIKKNATEELVYQSTETTMQLKHTVPTHTLKNGTLYNVRVAVLDIDNNISSYSDPVLFYCFTTPSFTFDNIEENQIIKNASYQINMSYSQIENEPLQSWEISLYDTSRSQIQTSGVNYTSDISYTLTNLEDNESYYLKATCMTLNGMEVETEYIPFSVNYKQPSVYSILTLENVADKGYIKLQSNIRAVEARTEKDAEYIDGEYINLKDNSVIIDRDFSLDNDFLINLVGYNFTPNSLIMELSDGVNKIALYFRKGTYDINDNVEKAFIELNVPVGFTSYICYSNYIDVPNETTISSVWIKRKYGIFSVYISDVGGE